MRLQINNIYNPLVASLHDFCVKEEDFYSTETENIEQVSIELFTRLRSFDTPVSRAIALEDDVDKAPGYLYLLVATVRLAMRYLQKRHRQILMLEIKVMFCLDHRAANHGY